MQKHFVRTIFLGCTQNLHLATRLFSFQFKKFKKCPVLSTIQVKSKGYYATSAKITSNTVELQWLEHLWDHEN